MYFIYKLSEEVVESEDWAKIAYLLKELLWGDRKGIHAALVASVLFCAHLFVFKIRWIPIFIHLENISH